MSSATKSSLDRHLDAAFKACAQVTGALSMALTTRRVTPRLLLKQVEQLKFATNQVEEAIGKLR